MMKLLSKYKVKVVEKKKAKMKKKEDPFKKDVRKEKRRGIKGNYRIEGGKGFRQGEPKK